MSESRFGWLAKAKDDIPRVLRGFWERRIQSDDPEFKNRKKYFKEYIQSCYLAADLQWTDEIDREFEAIIVEKYDFDRFKRFFGDWFTISNVMVIDRNHLIQPKEKEVKEIKENDLRDLSEFLRETKTSAAIAIGNAQSEFKTVSSPHVPPSKPFQIHSVTKMFTGALVLKMIERKVISEEELKKTLNEAFDRGFLKSLPEEFRKRFGEHLSKVTLFQLMTHQAGFGDYYEFENKSKNNYKNPRAYQKVILDAVSRDPVNPELPEIKQISDLLQFSEDKTYPIGEWNYSNVGITLVGLAIEYAYKQYKQDHPEDIIRPDFDSLLREYILKEAKIEFKNFTKIKPPDGRYNENQKADHAAHFITAGPAGYYWTTAEDLARFGSYFYNQYTNNAEFHRLVEQYGREFHPEEDVFSHTGTLTASSSAFLSVTKKGNIIAAVCDNSDEDANALEARIKRNIFSEPDMQHQEIISNQKLEKLMQGAFIPGLSVAFISPDQKIETHALGVTNLESKSPVIPETQFWACSLSKPIFAYLVIKLIQEKKLGERFGLDSPLPWDESRLGPQGDKKPFTVKMILSHMTGLPNEPQQDDPIFKASKPGEVFRYSGEGYVYLKDFIKAKIGKKLEAGKELEILTREFVFDRLGMTRSSFLYPEGEKNLSVAHNEAMEPNLSSKNTGNNDHPAASLYTTACDYARFLKACLQDEEFLKIIKIPQIESMEKDIEAKADRNILNSIAWGMGFALQKDKLGKPVIAFHWGHGPGARGFFAMNLEEPKSAMVYFANSDNGLAVAESLCSLTVGDIRPFMNYLSSKYGYKQVDFPGWQKYHEHIMAGAAAEKSGDFKAATIAYEKANIIRPGNNELQYRILWCNANEKESAIPDLDVLQKFNGQYGPVKVFIEGSKIKINPGDFTRDLKYAGDNIFLDGRVVLKFDISAKPPALTCLFPEGGAPVFSRMEEAKEVKATTARVAVALSIPEGKLLAASFDKDKQSAILDEESARSSSQSSFSDNSKNKVKISNDEAVKSPQQSFAGDHVVKKPK